MKPITTWWQRRTDPLRGHAKIEEGLINETARQAVGMEALHRPLHYLTEDARTGVVRRRQDGARGAIDGEHFWGTINCDGVNAKGDLG